jgi:hypothetical protein
MDKREGKIMKTEEEREERFSNPNGRRAKPKEKLCLS